MEIDFVAVSLVSCIVMIDGSFVVLDVSWCRFGRVVFRDDAFHVLLHTQ